MTSHTLWYTILDYTIRSYNNRLGHISLPAAAGVMHGQHTDMVCIDMSQHVLCTRVCIHMYICIYIYIERERDILRCMHAYIYIYIYM